MATIQQYLEQLQNDKQNLTTKLSEKGVEVTGDETFTQLIPKLDEIPIGEDISDYFIDIPIVSTSNNYRSLVALIKKLPPLTLQGSDVSSLFQEAKNLATLDLSNFDTSKVTNMSSMFSVCESLTSLDLSNFDTSKVTNMGSMFNYCKSLISLDLSNFDTSNVNSMANMFRQCESLTSLDLSNFDTSNVNSMIYMFENCTSLETLILKGPKLFNMKVANLLSYTKIARGTGYVYVPDDMIDTYKKATNWSVYANQIKSISELPEEG